MDKDLLGVLEFRLEYDTISPTWNSLRNIVKVLALHQLISWGEFNLAFLEAPSYPSDFHLKSELIVELEHFIHVLRHSMSYCTYNTIDSIVKITKPNDSIKRAFAYNLLIIVIPNSVFRNVFFIFLL